MQPEVEILVLPLYVSVEILVLPLYVSVEILALPLYVVGILLPPLYVVESVDLFAALLVMGVGDNRLYFFKLGVRRNLNSRQFLSMLPTYLKTTASSFACVSVDALAELLWDL